MRWLALPAGIVVGAMLHGPTRRRVHRWVWDVVEARLEPLAESLIPED